MDKMQKLEIKICKKKALKEMHALLAAIEAVILLAEDKAHCRLDCHTCSVVCS